METGDECSPETSSLGRLVEYLDDGARIRQLESGVGSVELIESEQLSRMGSDLLGFNEKGVQG